APTAIASAAASPPGTCRPSSRAKARASRSISSARCAPRPCGCRRRTIRRACACAARSARCASVPGGDMSAGEAGFDYIIERERGLRRDLSARRMTMIAIGGAIGTGLFLGSGFAIGLAGPGVLVSYVIGALIALLLMGCLAEMAVAHPTSGSFGAYAEQIGRASCRDRV